MTAHHSRWHKLLDRSREAFLSVATYAPGDGAVRYRFFPLTDEQPDYFSDGGIYTTLGIREAETWLAGWVACQKNTNRRIQALLDDAAPKGGW
jgi:hypothetical protein